MNSIQNPILRGFQPDPSILRVDHDYYIATSTFEWFPGIQIHHSRDLAHWSLVARPLDRVSQLDMLGVPDSCGVWAPCLSYDNGTFYLVYTNVRTFDGPWKDTPNFMVTSRSVTGPWSDPIFLNASGFDPSLFHDDDGRKWVLNMIMDHRGGKFFGGIVLQEYDPEAKRLVGPVSHIFGNTELGCTEGPHLYKRQGYYYLVMAEGGTEYNHAITVARSRTITGAYEVHPDNPMVSCAEDPEHPLQKTGHGSFVETPGGDWYVAFLTGRPLTTRGRCITGRETAIDRFQWDEDGWPRLSCGGRMPRERVEVSHEVAPAPAPRPARDDFDRLSLDPTWQSLRIPVAEDWLSLRQRPGFLRLFGRESLNSHHYQSLVARRVTEHHIQASCALEFSPQSYQQMAGLVCYYNSYNYHYLYVTADDQGRRIVNVITSDNYRMTEPVPEGVLFPENGPVFMKVDYDGAALRFYYGYSMEALLPIGPVLDGSILSDDYVCDEKNRYRPAFTGAFVGLCCQDLTGMRLHADFDWFEYRELPRNGR
ncbi:Glycoside hydrolase family 43 protein [Sulfidibacter corallicola]|uniref:Glycoside hydrolase family 43 protein n=1 Tax=Sulfidibacter corallicola TaxID=2818388 RepID=A0A8A4TJQ8_SULCO|nr:glycoside hydrolase family 43 protein [Sulfidibacter corallicola]QTD49717.1 glycoside hydrolase family 43 protein [Sulfidibacter corallicola]